MRDLESMSLRVRQNQLSILDQSLLPGEEKWVECQSPVQMIGLVRNLKVRGAPLIGIASSICLALTARGGMNREQLLQSLSALREARPTAVNLNQNLDRMEEVLKQEDWTLEALESCAEEIFDEDRELCEKIASHGEAIIGRDESVLTHCHTGGLATAGVGTALGVIRRANENGKNLHVFVDETRPLLQGGRLTTWELSQLRISYTLITDSMSAILMRQGKVDRVLVGADRIAKNGDFANKVGTYGLACLARHHSVPFYVVAPYTTIDPSCPNGDAIPIEERRAEEVRGAKGHFGEIQWSAENAPVFNPSFDVTPSELVTGGYILDAGVYDLGAFIKLMDD